MASDNLLKSFLDLMEEKKWVLRLKAGAEKIHRFSDPIEGVVKKEEVKVEVKKEGRANKGVLSGRPFLREAIDVSPLKNFHSQADHQAE